MQTESIETPIVTSNLSKEELDKIVRYHVWGAMGVGLIPLPLVDIAALTGIQVNLLRKLGNAYNIPLVENAFQKIISALLSSVMPKAFAPFLAVSITKIVPFLGQTAGVVTMPLVSGAATYALGKVFIQHFESGGTFLTFDPEQVKAYYAEMFKEGEKIVAEMKAEKPAEAERTAEPEQPAEAEKTAEPEQAEKAEKAEEPERPEETDVTEGKQQRATKRYSRTKKK